MLAVRARALARWPLCAVGRRRARAGRARAQASHGADLRRARRRRNHPQRHRGGSRRASDSRDGRDVSERHRERQRYGRQPSARAASSPTRMPRLILEARRVAATVIHGSAWAPPRRSGREFLAVSPLRLAASRRSDVDWRRSARDDHLYVREREWEASHTVWLWPDRSPSMDFTSASDGIDSKLDRALVVAVCARRSARAGRRARRHSRPDAADRQPQRHREDGRGHRPRSDRARQPAAELLAIAALRDRDAVGSVVADRRLPPHHRPAVGQRRARPRRADRRSGGRDVPLFGPDRIHRAGRRRQRHRRPRRDLAQRLSGPRRAPSRGVARRDRPASAGASSSIAPTAARPNSCSRCTRAWAPARSAVVNSRHAPAAQRKCPHDRRPCPLGFAQPLVLLGLLSLPVLWWLLRLVPPRPRRIDFPPTRLLFEIAPKEETPSRTPWWLTLLRLSLAALVIIAAAGPLWNPPLGDLEPRRAAA